MTAAAPCSTGMLSLLSDAPARIAYFGTSVTAQRAGYRPRLHRSLITMTGQEHSAIAAGLSGMGSMSGNYLMDLMVLRHVPDLCFVEFSSADSLSFTPPDLVGRVLEGMMRRLLGMGCAPVLVHAPHDIGQASQIRSALDVYETVAAHYGIRTVDLWESPERLGQPNEEVRYDLRHTTALGSRLYAEEIVRQLCDAPARKELRSSLPEPLHPDRHEFVAVQPIPDNAPVTGPAARRLFRGLVGFVKLDSGGSIQLTPRDGEASGLLIVAGPDCGVVELSYGGARQAVQLWEPDYAGDSLQAIVLDPPATGPVTISTSTAEYGDRDRYGRATRTSHEGSSVGLVGLMVHHDKPVAATGWWKAR